VVLHSLKLNSFLEGGVTDALAAHRAIVSIGNASTAMTLSEILNVIDAHLALVDQSISLLIAKLFKEIDLRAKSVRSSRHGRELRMVLPHTLVSEAGNINPLTSYQFQSLMKIMNVTWPGRNLQMIISSWTMPILYFDSCSP
jgi:hypothetical protein